MAARSEIIILEGEHIVRNLGEINQGIDGIFRRVVDPHLKKHMRSFMNTQSDMKKYPGPVVYPIEWESEAQERWSRWALGQDILPSTRTGEFFRNYDVRVNRALAESAIVNTSEYADFLVGEQQQRFHGNTGYRKITSYEDDLLDSSRPVIARGFDSEIRVFLFNKGLL